MTAYPVKAATPTIVWKFEVGNRLVPTKEAGIIDRTERVIVQRMMDVDTGMPYYRFMVGHYGTTLDSAYLMEKNFELVTTPKPKK